MVLWLNLKSFFSNRLLSAVFCVLLVICLAGGLFGVNYAMCNVNFYNRYASSQKLYTIINSGSDTSESVENFLEKYSKNIDYLLCYTDAEIEGEEVELTIVSCLDGVADESLFAAYGEEFSVEYNEGDARKIWLKSSNESVFDTSWIGKTVSVFGEDFEVAGLINERNMISYYALTDTSVVEKIEFSLCEPIKKAGDREEFLNDITEIFSGFRISAPDTGDMASIFAYAPMMLPTLILVALGFINLGFLYVFFIKMRKRQYAIFRMEGASVPRIFALFLLEVLILYTAAFLLSAVIFKIMASVSFVTVTTQSMLAIESGILLTDSLTFLTYLCVYLVLAVLLVIAFIPTLLRTLSRDIFSRGKG